MLVSIPLLESTQAIGNRLLWSYPMSSSNKKCREIGLLTLTTIKIDTIEKINNNSILSRKSYQWLTGSLKLNVKNTDYKIINNY
jgi:hypothetical protein